MPRHFAAITPEEADPRLQGLHAYWRAKAPAPLLPSRQAVDPLELKDLLGQLMLVDVVREAGHPPRFRYRLFGSGYTFYHGRDLTGKWVDEVAEPTFRDDLLNVYAFAAREARPGFYAYDYILEAERHRFHAALLPLAENGRDVDMVMTCALKVGTEAV